VIKDLGVFFDPDLSFVLQEEIKLIGLRNAAEITRRNFMYLSEEAFGLLYKTLVRSQLDYANSAWNPYKIR